MESVLSVCVCVLEGLWGKNTDKDTSREGAAMLRRFHCDVYLVTLRLLNTYSAKANPHIAGFLQ